MSVEAAKDVKCSGFSSTTSREISETRDGVSAGLSGTHNHDAVPRLKSSSPLCMSSPAPRTCLRGTEGGGGGGGSPGMPAIPSAAALSPVGSPRVAPLAQESVSVIVRLKGVGTPGGDKSLTSPITSTLLSSPRSVPLLDFSVEDGTLRTPRTGRRPAPRISVPLSPRPYTDRSPSATSEVPTQPQRSSALTSALVSSEVFYGGGGGSAASPSSPLTVGVMLPKAFTSPTIAMDGVKSTPRGSAKFNKTAVNSSHIARPQEEQHPRSGSSAIGCRGRVLTIRPPPSDDCRQYEFGEVFEPDVTNTALCERLVPAIMEQMSANYNVCVLCYGQTGSGKTYTVNALAPAISAEVFRTLDANNEVVEMSYIQIYNNKAYNLLEGPRSGKFGAELSKPLHTLSNSSSTITTTDGTAGGATISGAPYGGTIPINSGNSVSEPKTLVRSAAEVLAKMRSAARMRVTHAHALNPHSSRAFTLLTLHVTRFLDGAPLTTTRVTIADLAGAERLKKSGATGEGQSQAIFINKSLMALRELVESNNTETEVLHFRDSLLTTYLAPRMRSWHLFLLVTVSLEASNYEETKSSLDFATNARRRKVKKLKSRTADRLAGTSLARVGGGNSAGGSGYAEVAELQSVIEALQYRISVLEESLKVAQLQRSALTQMCTPVRSPLTDESLLLPRETGGDDKERSEADRPGSEASVERLRQSETQIRQLRQECRQYRQLLREREEELRQVQTLIPSSSSAGEAALTPTGSERTSSLLVPVVSGPLRTNSNNTSDHQPHSHHNHSHHHQRPSSLLAEVNTTTEAAQGQLPQHQLLSSRSSLSASVLSGDAVAAAATATSTPAGQPVVDGGEQKASGTAAFIDDAAEDAHALLIDHVQQLRSRLRADADPEVALEQLREVTLRAKEQDDDVRERLLVVTSTLGGLRAQNHQLHDEILQSSRAALAQDEGRRRYRELSERAHLRASVAEAAVEALRLQLFRAYAEQPIGEELTRLYLDETRAAEAADTLSGTQLAEHREEMKNFETHQRALQDKITELVNTVEHLTRAGSQKDVALAALESLITPTQRALFHTMSSPRGSSDDVATATATAAPTSGTPEDGAVDCFSLLQSRVSELEALLRQERQQHQLTRCEVIEAREDARRSRQEQRQAFLQQQEEERRVAQLTAENFDLRQLNEQHQMYLDQVHVQFQEQLLELRHYHVAEMAEQRRLLEEAHQQQRQQQQQLAQPAPLSAFNRGEEEDDESDAARGDIDARRFGQSSTRRGTSQSPLHRSHDRRAEETARGWAAGPPSHRTNATAADEFRRNNSTTLPQFNLVPSPKVRSSHTLPYDKSKSNAVPGEEGTRRSAGRKKVRAAKKTKGKRTAARGRRSDARASPASCTSSHTNAFKEGRRRASLALNLTESTAAVPRFSH